MRRSRVVLLIGVVWLMSSIYVGFIILTTSNKSLKLLYVEVEDDDIHQHQRQHDQHQHHTQQQHDQRHQQQQQQQRQQHTQQQQQIHQQQQQQQQQLNSQRFEEKLKEVVFPLEPPLKNVDRHDDRSLNIFSSNKKNLINVNHNNNNNNINNNNDNINNNNHNNNNNIHNNNNNIHNTNNNDNINNNIHNTNNNNNNNDNINNNIHNNIRDNINNENSNINNDNIHNDNINNDVNIAEYQRRQLLIQEAKMIKKKKMNQLKAMLPHSDHSHGNHSNSQGWDLYLKYKDTPSRRLWPMLNDREDRVLHQIHRVIRVNKSQPMKLIYMGQGLEGDMVRGQQRFIDHKCPVNWCSITDDPSVKNIADLIFYKDDVPIERDDVLLNGGGGGGGGGCVNKNQVKLLFLLESPMHTGDFNVEVNWTATYRTDSTLNAPYERFTFFNNFTKLPDKPYKNFALGKKKKVAWFVSNCAAGNGRTEYALELSKYIDVDIYGGCGKHECSRMNEKECFEILRNDYKFYLSFENSNCKDYITEKLFVNALSNDVLPIVMGARPEDYKRLAPPQSFIHVDDFDSPSELAAYLHKLDQNDDLYNNYFRWKGYGEMIDTKFWCRLCTMLHEQHITGTKLWYNNVNNWWRGPGVCITPPDSGLSWASWRHYKGPTANMNGTFHLLPGNKFHNNDRHGNKEKRGNTCLN